MKTLLITLAGLFALNALADDAGLPLQTPAAYKSECGGCHVPFPPSLLSAADWRKTMAGLDRHFGSDASLDAGTRATLLAFLERHAGRHAGLSGGAAPRITGTAWFAREHEEVPARLWKDAKVKNPANCSACHQGAEQGRYGERELAVPRLARRHGGD